MGKIKYNSKMTEPINAIADHERVEFVSVHTEICIKHTWIENPVRDKGWFWDIETIRMCNGPFPSWRDAVDDAIKHRTESPQPQGACKTGE